MKNIDRNSPSSNSSRRIFKRHNGRSKSLDLSLPTAKRHNGRSKSLDLSLPTYVEVGPYLKEEVKNTAGNDNAKEKNAVLNVEKDRDKNSYSNNNVPVADGKSISRCKNIIRCLESIEDHLSFAANIVSITAIALSKQDSVSMGIAALSYSLLIILPHLIASCIRGKTYHLISRLIESPDTWSYLSAIFATLATGLSPLTILWALLLWTLFFLALSAYMRLLYYKIFEPARLTQEHNDEDPESDIYKEKVRVYQSLLNQAITCLSVILGCLYAPAIAMVPAILIGINTLPFILKAVATASKCRLIYGTSMTIAYLLCVLASGNFLSHDPNAPNYYYAVYAALVGLNILINCYVLFFKNKTNSIFVQCQNLRILLRLGSN